LNDDFSVRRVPRPHPPADHNWRDCRTLALTHDEPLEEVVRLREGEWWINIPGFCVLRANGVDHLILRHSAKAAI
jgi:hypothetical protein